MHGWSSDLIVPRVSTLASKCLRANKAMSRRFSPGRRAHAGTCLGEAFFDLAGRETVELTIPDGADIRGDLRQMQSLILGLKAEPCDEVRRDGNDFFSCRIKEWQAHCLTNREAGGRARRELPLVQMKPKTARPPLAASLACGSSSFKTPEFRPYATTPNS